MFDHFLNTKWTYFPLSSQIPNVCSDQSKLGVKPILCFLCKQRIILQIDHHTYLGNPMLGFKESQN